MQPFPLEPVYLLRF